MIYKTHVRVRLRTVWKPLLIPAASRANRNRIAVFRTLDTTTFPCTVGAVITRAISWFKWHVLVKRF